MALVTANQFDLVPDASKFVQGLVGGQTVASNQQAIDRNRLAARQSLQNTQFAQQALGGDKEALTSLAGGGEKGLAEAENIRAFLANQSEEDRAETVRENEVMTRAALTALTLPPEQRRAFIVRERDIAAQEGRSTARVDRALSGSDEQLNQDLTVQAREGRKINELAKQQFPDKPTAQTPLQIAQTAKAKAEAEKIKREGQPVSQAAGLNALTPEGTSPELSASASAAFNLAGGGKEGVKAFNKAIELGSETERRAASPQLLANNFPEASPEEMSQLQAAMDSGKTTESGMSAAQDVRKEQRRVKKAKGFQVRAVELLDTILANPELNDVLGSVEGSDEGLLFGKKIRSDGEAEAIADIEEAQSILTADNMDLMSGVLSESDIAILKAISSGGLNRKRGEARFISDVTKLRDKLLNAQTDSLTPSDEELLTF